MTLIRTDCEFRMKTKTFLSSATYIFGASIAGKVLSVLLHDGTMLSPASPILRAISQRQFLTLTACLEALVLVFLNFSTVPVRWKAYVVYSLAVVFVGYHLLLIASGKPTSCACLGWFSEARVNAILEWITYPLLAFLLIGGAFCSVREFQDAKHTPTH